MVVVGGAMVAVTERKIAMDRDPVMVPAAKIAMVSVLPRGATGVGMNRAVVVPVPVAVEARAAVESVVIIDNARGYFTLHSPAQRYPWQEVFPCIQSLCSE